MKIAKCFDQYLFKDFSTHSNRVWELYDKDYMIQESTSVK
jgi:hypothetical protein